MIEVSGLQANQTKTADTAKLSKALHDFCQPLTTLQCRLEMAGVIGTMESYREAVEQGLIECSRLLDSVAGMREIVRTIEKQRVEELGRAV